MNDLLASQKLCKSGFFLHSQPGPTQVSVQAKKKPTWCSDGSATFCAMSNVQQANGRSGKKSEPLVEGNTRMATRKRTQMMAVLYSTVEDVLTDL